MWWGAIERLNLSQKAQFALDDACAGTADWPWALDSRGRLLLRWAQRPYGGLGCGGLGQGAEQGNCCLVCFKSIRALDSSICMLRVRHYIHE